MKKKLFLLAIPAILLTSCKIIYVNSSSSSSSSLSTAITSSSSTSSTISNSSTNTNISSSNTSSSTSSSFSSTSSSNNISTSTSSSTSSSSFSSSFDDSSLNKSLHSFESFAVFFDLQPVPDILFYHLFCISLPQIPDTAPPWQSGQSLPFCSGNFVPVSGIPVFSRSRRLSPPAPVLFFFYSNIVSSYFAEN